MVTKTHLLEKLLDHDDDEQEVNRTQPFKLVEASTAKPGGETIEMQTMQHEQSRLPDTSYEETHLLGDFLSPEEKKSRLEKALAFIKKGSRKLT